MSQVHALSDDQVGQELRKMTAFIRQEASEKAHEIKLKANEEFAIEKSKLVRQETDAIDSAYSKKFKQAVMSQQITRSTLANKTRLAILNARQALLDDVFAAAHCRLADQADDAKRYELVLVGLILEAAYAMGEDVLRVHARERDNGVVKKAMEKAGREYKDKVGAEVKLTLDESSPVPADSAGGVIVSGGGGKIEIDNTFEGRLKLLQDTALPAVRQHLFGKNPNRKFYD